MDLKRVSSLLKSNAQLLNIFRCYNNIGRNELCQLMNQSWPTISKSIEDLKGENVLLKEKEYTINPDLGYYVGISIGGSQIKLSLIDMMFQPLNKTEFETLIKKYTLFEELDYLEYSCNESYGYVYTNTPHVLSNLQKIVDELLTQIINLDSQLICSDQHIFGIGFALTGAIDNKSKKIIKAYSLKCINTLPLSYDSLIFDTKLSYFNTHDINLSFDNIAKSALISEKFALYNPDNPNARYSHKRNIACIYLGSGIGSSLIFNNTLYRGTSNFNELGHIDVIDPISFNKDAEDELLQNNGNIELTCSCGGLNCLEYKIRKYVFGSDFQKFSSLTATNLKKEFDKLNLEEKEKKLKLLAFYINQAAKTLVNTLNLDLIILTGKLTIFMDELSNYLYEEKSKNTIGYTNSDCSMVISNYGALAPSIGAAITSSFSEGDDIIVWK